MIAAGRMSTPAALFKKNDQKIILEGEKRMENQMKKRKFSEKYSWESGYHRRRRSADRPDHFDLCRRGHALHCRPAFYLAGRSAAFLHGLDRVCSRRSGVPHQSHVAIEMVVEMFPEGVQKIISYVIDVVFSGDCVSALQQLRIYPDVHEERKKLQHAEDTHDGTVRNCAGFVRAYDCKLFLQQIF